ncbi:hypothetical protein LP109_08980 [Moraxella bovis]|uniref:hypothetical protein n=1 Tax=Moraxella bovis TaxID=476 RepID=UPI00099300BE|nr:hypothetical protein [Moraxella bovis]AWY19898.1 hypothetical protein DQF64_04920 [Moraxella bovis]OOR89220.1 hypothetical protein B0182_07515 [Moraxella bovis]UZA15796.1 hypothetical protein LP109_08980 [Moraxella bovis]
MAYYQEYKYDFQTKKIGAILIIVSISLWIGNINLYASSSSFMNNSAIFFAIISVLFTILGIYALIFLKPTSITLTDDKISLYEKPFSKTETIIYYQEITKLKEKQINKNQCLLIFVNHKKYKLIREFFESIDEFNEVVELIRTKV